MKTVLIADDAVFMRMMLKDILTKSGWTVTGEAENGEEAVHMFSRLKPDLVLIDILMPFKDGLQAAQEIINFEPNAKIIMISAFGQEAQLKKAVEIGTLDFIKKPFSPEKVKETINKVFNNDI